MNKVLARGLTWFGEELRLSISTKSMNNGEISRTSAPELDSSVILYSNLILKTIFGSILVYIEIRLCLSKNLDLSSYRRYQWLGEEINEIDVKRKPRLEVVNLRILEIIR